MSWDDPMDYWQVMSRNYIRKRIEGCAAPVRLGRVQNEEEESECLSIFEMKWHNNDDTWYHSSHRFSSWVQSYSILRCSSFWLMFTPGYSFMNPQEASDDEENWKRWVRAGWKELLQEKITCCSYTWHVLFVFSTPTSYFPVKNLLVILNSSLERKKSQITFSGFLSRVTLNGNFFFRLLFTPIYLNMRWKIFSLFSLSILMLTWSESMFFSVYSSFLFWMLLKKVQLGLASHFTLLFRLLSLRSFFMKIQSMIKDERREVWCRKRRGEFTTGLKRSLVTVNVREVFTEIIPKKGKLLEVTRRYPIFQTQENLSCRHDISSFSSPFLPDVRKCSSACLVHISLISRLSNDDKKHVLTVSEVCTQFFKMKSREVRKSCSLMSGLGTVTKWVQMRWVAESLLINEKVVNGWTALASQSEKKEGRNTGFLFLTQL